jgi:hypothetical protein
LPGFFEQIKSRQTVSSPPGHFYDCEATSIDRQAVSQLKAAPAHLCPGRSTRLIWQ